jgi:hypothetical protein
MSTWIQLKDGVAFASVESNQFVENSILLEDELSWDDVKAKKYENNSWVEAPLIYFITQLINGKVHQVNSTVFSSDVTGEICPPETRIMWTKNEDGTFSPPSSIGEATIYDEHLFEQPVTE